MLSLDKTREDLFNLLTAKNYEFTTRSHDGKETLDPKQAELSSFEYITNGNNYGTVVVRVNTTGVEIYYSDALGKSMETEDKTNWYNFLYQLRHFARAHMLDFSIKNLNKLKYSMQSMAQVQEGKYYGFKNTSYTRPTKKAKLKIIHSKPIEEETDARYRNIAALYVENASGERFKLPFTKIAAGKAMAMHVTEGGTPYDAFGLHICEMVSDISTLSNFIRSAHGKEWSDTHAQSLVELAVKHYAALKRKVKRIISHRGYHEEKNNWNPNKQLDQTAVTEQIRELFTERLLDSRIEKALPVLAKLEYKENTMKEFKEFENWAGKVAEGSWALPGTSDDVEELIDWMREEHPVGVEAQDATNSLYNIIGDDRLFDRLGELAKTDPKADARDVVASWLYDNLPHVYQQIEHELGDPDIPGEPNEEQVDEDDQDNDPKEQSREAAQSAIIRRILHSHSDLLMAYGPEAVTDAVEEYAYNLDDLEEIGTSDVSIWVQGVINMLGEMDMQKDDDRQEYQQHYAGNDTENDPQVRYEESKEEYCTCGCDCGKKVCETCGKPHKAKDVKENSVSEVKDKVLYDPKTGKLTGWEHEGDWEKTKGQKKDPIGKVHHMSDVALRQTEKMADKSVEVLRQAKLVKKEIGYPNYKAFDAHDVRYISDKSGMNVQDVCKLLHIQIPAGINEDQVSNSDRVNLPDESSTYWDGSGRLQAEYKLLYKQLVPSQGPADTIEGEVLRAASKIVGRHYNDGDEFNKASFDQLRPFIGQVTSYDDLAEKAIEYALKAQGNYLPNAGWDSLELMDYGPTVDDMADDEIDDDVEEGFKPDFLDLDKDGDTKEPMKKAAKELEEVNNYQIAVGDQITTTSGKFNGTVEKVEETDVYFRSSDNNKLYKTTFNKVKPNSLVTEEKAVMINNKTVDLKSIELDGVDNGDYPDFADAYAIDASFTDGTALTDDELEQFTDTYGDIINQLAHGSLEGAGDFLGDSQIKEDELGRIIRLSK